MKTKSKLFFWVLTLGMFFAACDKENNDLTTAIIDDAITEEPIDDVIEMGTVSLNAFIKDVIEVTTGKAPTLDEVLDDLNVHIYSIDAAVEIINSNYRDLPEFIELPTGNYNLTIQAFLPAIGSPLYGAQESFVVTTGTNTNVSLEISLMSLGVTLNFSQDIELNYPSISAVATVVWYDIGLISTGTFWVESGLEDNGLTKYLWMDSFSESIIAGVFERQIPYYADLTIDVSAIDPITNVEINVSKTYPGVVANQHYNIAIEYTSASTASLNITLGDETVIEDTITFPN